MCVCVCMYAQDSVYTIHAYVHTADDLIDILEYKYIHDAYLNTYVCMWICIYIYILCISIYVCVFIWNSSAFLIVSFYVFLSLLLCLPFIVSLFLLRAYWWQNPAIFKYDIRSILFVNLKLTQHWPSAVHQMGVNILLKCGSSSNAASHQRTKSLRTMPSIRFQSASKSAHTCSSRNNNNNKKIHTDTHTHTTQQQQQQRVQHWQLHSHTRIYTQTDTHTQQKLQRTPFEEWAPRPTQGPNSAIRWQHEAFAIISISILVIDSCTHLYICDRQTDNQKQK